MSETFRKVFVKNGNGVTLVELILVLALLLVAATLTFTFISYMHNSSETITTQAEAQENVIIAKSIIDDKILNALSIVICAAGEDPPSENWSVTVFREVIDGRGIIFVQKNGEDAVPLLSNLEKDYSMQLSFERAGDSFIAVSISCSSAEGHEYSVENGLFLLGFAPHQFIGESGERIYITNN